MKNNIAEKYFKNEVMVVIEGIDKRKESIFFMPLEFAMTLNIGDALMFNSEINEPLPKWLLETPKNYEELLDTCVKITERHFLFDSVLFYADYF